MLSTMREILDIVDLFSSQLVWKDSGWIDQSLKSIEYEQKALQNERIVKLQLQRRSKNAYFCLGSLVRLILLHHIEQNQKYLVSMLREYGKQYTKPYS